MIIKTYSIGKLPAVKSTTICGINGGQCWPLIYLMKPKYLSQESFDAVVGSISLFLPPGIEMKEDK